MNRPRFRHPRRSAWTATAGSILALALGPATALAQTWTWDGGGADNNFTTAANWNPNTVPTNGPGTTLIFAGTTRLTPVVNVAYQVDGITFAGGAGSFSISGTGLTIGSGGVTHNDNSSQTLTVPLTLSASQTWRCTSSGALNINSATIAGGGFTLTVDSDGLFGSFIAVAGAISGSGTSLTKKGSELLRLSGANSFTGTTRIEAGTLRLLGNERLSNASDVVIDGGSLDLDFSGAIETVDQVTLISGDITGTGGDPAETLVASAFDVRAGDISVALAGPGALTKTTGGTVSLAAGNTYSGGTAVNEGVLRLANSGTTTGSGNVVVGIAGVIQGEGTIPASLDCAGRIQPGDSLGLLTLNNSLTLQSSSHVDIVIGGSTAGQYDVLDVDGAAALAGALNITLVNGFTPTPGQQFLVMEFASKTGNFAAINPPPGPTGCFATTVGPAGVMLVVGSDADCNTNNTPDCSDIAAAESSDCNTNALPDSCDLAQPALRSESVLGNWPIPDADPAGLTSVLSFAADSRIITELNVQLWIEHVWQGDLVVSLEHAGVVHELLHRPGQCGSGSGFGYESNHFGIDNLQALVLDDSASVEIDCYDGPGSFGIDSYRGPARPTQPLARLNGQVFEGDWTLTAADLSPEDLGRLRFWRLDALVVSADCNANGVPDECDPPFGAGGDCQPDGIADECQLAGNDCNTNATPDDCELAGGAIDCQPDGTPDICQLGLNDCNTNHTPDDCEPDCNTNQTLDTCDISAMTDADCNTNSSPDSCDLTQPVARSAALIPLVRSIPDNNPAGLTENLTFTPDQRVITDLSVQLLIMHDWQGDLGVALEHSGITRQLMLRPGLCLLGSEIGYGSRDFGLNLDQTLRLDDAAPVAIDCYAGAAATGIDNYQGPARPTQPLSGFNGQGLAGDWALTAADLDPAATGSLLFCSLDALTVCADCDTNGVPDECEADCNTNFVNDVCEPALHRADMNCDCVVNAADIAPLVQAMLDPAGYATAYPNCTILHADTQPDARVDGDDLQELLNVLIP